MANVTGAPARHEHGQTITLRKPTLYVFTWIGTVFVWFFLLIALFITASASLFDHLQLIAVVCVVTWFVRLAAITPRIVVSDAGLVVVSWFRHWDIPWSAVDSVTAPGGLEIRLTDGRTIGPSVAGDSVLGTLTGNSAQRRMLDAITATRPAVPPRTDLPVQRRLDLEPVKFAVLLVAFIVVAVLIALVAH
jgi:Bacterial PH domain